MRIDATIIRSVLNSRPEMLKAAGQGDAAAIDFLTSKIVDCLGLTPLMSLVSLERCKQIVKGYDAKHDDIHTLGQLTMGAICYAQTAFTQVNSPKPLPPCFHHKDWPWERGSFHAHADPVANLIKAAAMLIAEAERIERTRGDASQPVPDDMFLAGQIKVGIDLAIKRDKIGTFLAAVSAYVQAVLCEARPERLEEALKDIERFDVGQSSAMVEVQNGIAAWVRAEMKLLHDPAYQDLRASAAEELNTEGGEP